MNEIELLHELLNQLRAEEFISQNAKDEYEKLVNSFEEEGFERIYSIDAESEEQENSRRDLRKFGYLKTFLKYHGSDGHFWHINLRADQYEAAACRHKTQTGKTETFTTGAIRDTAKNKPRPELISPFATEQLGDWLRKGADKYSARNWEKGITLSRCLASCLRHITKFQQGDETEDHLVAAYCNIMFMLHTREMCKRGVLPDSLMDMPNYSKPQENEV